MAYYECVTNAHLAPLPNNKKTAQESSTSDDSAVEVTSSIDSYEHEPVSLNSYLHVHSDDDSTDGGGETLSKPIRIPRSLVSYSIPDESANEFDPNQMHAPTSTSVAPSIRSKRRQWSIRETLLALVTLDTKKNKYKTCKIHGCSPSYQ